MPVGSCWSTVASTSTIDLIYEQRGTELEERRGNFKSPAWDPHGHGGHSVEGQRHALEHYVDGGGIALGAFSEGRLVGIGAETGDSDPIASPDQVGQGCDGVSDGVGSGGLEFAAADWRLGEADGSYASGPADLDVGHRVADQDGLMGGPVKEVERTLNG